VHQGERRIVEHIPCYKLESDKADWQGFSFNPGLRRKADYLAFSPYAQYTGEKDLSRLYAANDRYALILENDAVLHTGFGNTSSFPRSANPRLAGKRWRKSAFAWHWSLASCLEC
jgi:hypothetical protein